MSKASRTIQSTFIAPPTSNSAISAQQQPTQYILRASSFVSNSAADSRAGDMATVAVYERATGITNERRMNQLGR